jgi:tetratricopeptide (TPR) repeat protein
MAIPMTGLSPELQALVEDGLKLCRSGDWNKGLPLLAAVLEQRTPTDTVPGIVYSYLGYGVAKYQGQVREGVKLCDHAIKVEYYEAENHWNLSRVYVIAGDRLAAFHAISRGLKLNPDHAGLLATQTEIGVRKPPVLKFLSRDHPINVYLGKWRHARSGVPSGLQQRPARPDKAAKPERKTKS